NVAAQGPELDRVLDRLRGRAEAELEALGLELGQLLDELVTGKLAQVACVQHAQISSRLTIRVRTGSLAMASAIDLRASSSGPPSTPKSSRPGMITATQPSGLPLPLPMRTSAGFLVTGLSGKIRIQTLPPRFISRVIATRDASICREVIHPGSSDMMPHWPNATLLPRVAIPVVRPLNVLRNLIRLGASIDQLPVL